MRKFLWLNPVVLEMYGGIKLDDQLRSKGYELVNCQQDHLAAVKKKYRKAIGQTHACVADTRCPMAVQYIKKNYALDFLEFPDIEPILLHCARELHERFSAQGTLFVITPCAALRELGNSLELSSTRFYTWTEFARRETIFLHGRTLLKSPIPPGFFEEYGQQTEVLDSRDKIDLYFAGAPLTADKKVMELLYCPDGCHHGDGVGRIQ